eukprot:1096620-Rhodomonas_salina.2
MGDLRETWREKAASLGVCSHFRASRVTLFSTGSSLGRDFRGLKEMVQEVCDPIEIPIHVCCEQP